MFIMVLSHAVYIDFVNEPNPGLHWNIVLIPKMSQNKWGKYAGFIDILIRKPLW